VKCTTEFAQRCRLGCSGRAGRYDAPSLAHVHAGGDDRLVVCFECWATKRERKQGRETEREMGAREREEGDEMDIERRRLLRGYMIQGLLGTVLPFCLQVKGLTKSPITGPNGNVEFIVWVRMRLVDEPFHLRAAGCFTCFVCSCARVTSL